MSSNIASAKPIIVNNISKTYQLLAHQGSLRDAVAQWIRSRSNGSQAERDRQVLWALKNVSFELARGEALGIVGPNGAGKTTILKILSRVTRPTTGELQVKGRLGALLELGAGFHPDLTGRENVYLYGSILGLSRKTIDQKFDQIVDFSGLERFMDTPVKRYSSGMYVRLAFSVAAHTDPDILLVDEVLAVGDAEFRQRCIQHIKSLQQDGVSIIFISHNLFQVRAVCERGIFLQQGQIQMMGDSDQAIGAYESWMLQNQKTEKVEETFDFHAGQGGSDLRLLGIEVYDLLGQWKKNFAYNEGVEIQLHFLTYRRFQNTTFDIRIIRTDGLVCSMLRSLDLGYQLDELRSQGFIILRLEELRLATGTYFVEARLRDSLDAVTLAKSSSPAFNVDAPTPGTGMVSGVYVPRVLSVAVSTNHHEAVKQHS